MPFFLFLKNYLWCQACLSIILKEIQNPIPPWKLGWESTISFPARRKKLVPDKNSCFSLFDCSFLWNRLGSSVYFSRRKNRQKMLLYSFWFNLQKPLNMARSVLLFDFHQPLLQSSFSYNWNNNFKPRFCYENVGQRKPPTFT